jgi:hypothetical protein
MFMQGLCSRKPPLPIPLVRSSPGPIAALEVLSCTRRVDSRNRLCHSGLLRFLWLHRHGTRVRPAAWHQTAAQLRSAFALHLTSRPILAQMAHVSGRLAQETMSTFLWVALTGRHVEPSTATSIHHHGGVRHVARRQLALHVISVPLQGALA